jgi:nucleotide-binding universal stress UspA family protein
MVKRAGERMFRRILVPLDGSQFSERALPYAIEIARNFDAELMLLKVIRQTPIITSIAPTESGVLASSDTTQIIVETAKQRDERNMDVAHRYLRKEMKKVTVKNINGTYHVVLGDPAKSITKFCQEKSIDLVVMTTSGKSGLKRAFLGSVADVVIREPGIPVLAIRPEID